MAKRYDRVHRLLRIITLIQSRRGCDVRFLAQECGVSQRMIYRDLNMLEGAGVPCSFDEETHGYRIRGDFFLPPVDLNLEESLALIALAQQIARGGKIPHLHHAGRAVSKIRSRLPQAIRARLAELDDHVSIHLARTAPEGGDHDVYELIRRGIATRRALSCRYESPGKGSRTAPQFLFRPYSLYFGQRAWYVIGHHGGHDEVRCLKLNRFTQASPTEQAYAIPDDFSLERYFGKAWRMIPDRHGKTHHVELHFDAQFAETIQDTHWHDTQEVEHLDDGAILFRCEVSGLSEIVWWILSMGPHCTVRQPAELARQVADLASQISNLYPATPPQNHP